MTDMKTLFVTLILVLFGVQVNAQTNTTGYIIKGLIKGLPEGSAVYLTKNKSDGSTLDTISTTLARNGEFRFTGTLNKEAQIYFIFLEKSVSGDFKTIFLDNSKIELLGDLGSWPKITIKGSVPTIESEKLTSLLDPYLRTLQSVQKELLDNVFRIDSIKKQLISGDASIIKSKIEALESRKKSLTDTYYKTWDDFIIQHPNSLFVPRSIMKRTQMSTKEKEIAFQGLSEKSRRSYYGEMLKMQIEREKIMNTIKVGARAVDFVSTTPDGKNMRLMEFVTQNKLTLVDFWGSWCVPCRKGIPKLKEVYEAFHSRGFNILSVSSETSKNAWLKALREENMPWPQVSQIKGGNEDANNIYNVNGVPAFILIDREGKIVSIDLPASIIPTAGPSLRKDELYKTIETLLEKNGK
jgi:thiol-disulfide isomerase/thioredoxin